MNIPSTKPTVQDGAHVLCVSCSREVSKGFCKVGKVWITTNFLRKTRPVMTYDPSTGAIAHVMEEKIVPIEGYSKGFVCSDCQSDYRTITRTRKDGTEYWIPKVILEPTGTVKESYQRNGRKITHTVPVNSGMGNERVKVERESAPLDRYGFEEKPIVHLGSYEKFGRGK